MDMTQVPLVREPSPPPSCYEAPCQAQIAPPNLRQDLPLTASSEVLKLDGQYVVQEF